MEITPAAFDRKEFYNRLRKLALPIALQSLMLFLAVVVICVIIKLIIRHKTKE